MKTATFFAFASLLAGAFATPVASPDKTADVAPPFLPSPEAEFAEVDRRAIVDERGEVVKRVEGVHLLNCNNRYSVILYCPNDSSCSHVPNNACTYSSIVTWEGGRYSCTFPTGVSFWWNIRSDAQSQPNFSVVGNAGNGFTNFVVRKDSQNTFYTDGNGNACKSIYYSLPN